MDPRGDAHPSRPPLDLPLVSHMSCGYIADPGPTLPALAIHGPANCIPILRHVQHVQPGPQHTRTPCQTCLLSILVCQQVEDWLLMEMLSCFLVMNIRFQNLSIFIKIHNVVNILILIILLITKSLYYYFCKYFYLCLQTLKFFLKKVALNVAMISVYSQICNLNFHFQSLRSFSINIQIARTVTLIFFRHLTFAVHNVLTYFVINLIVGGS